MLQMNRLLAWYKSMTDRILDEDIVYRTAILYRFLLLFTILAIFQAPDEQSVGQKDEYSEDNKP